MTKADKGANQRDISVCAASVLEVF